MTPLHKWYSTPFRIEKERGNNSHLHYKLIPTIKRTNTKAILHSLTVQKQGIFYIKCICNKTYVFMWVFICNKKRRREVLLVFPILPKLRSIMPSRCVCLSSSSSSSYSICLICGYHIKQHMSEQISPSGHIWYFFCRSPEQHFKIGVYICRICIGEVSWYLIYFLRTAQ